MENEGLISVIIPVYNGERHIEKCYNSLKYQSYNNWEAIFINDGSHDNSFQILNEIAESDPRIRIIDKKNEGVAIAREVGLQNANGSIITFLDVDDFFEKDSLNIFQSTLSSRNIDIVVGGVRIEYGIEIPSKLITYPNQLLDRRAALNKICEGKIRWQLWAKAFKRKTLLDSVTPNGLKNGEDMAVCIQAFCYADNIATITQITYNYVQNPSSATHAQAKTIAKDSIYAVKLVENTVGKIIGKKNLDCLYLQVFSNVLRLGINDKYLWKDIKKYFSLMSIKRLHLKKIINLSIYRIFKINLNNLFKP